MSNVSDAFNDFGKYLVQQSRSNLTREGHRATSDLYQSLNYDFKEHPNSIEFTFNMEDYGDFLDKGVKGKESSAKAPNSPYRFGSGQGTGSLSKAIREWVQVRNIQFRKPNGRFMTYNSTAFLISRSIWKTGTPTTEFYSKPLERGMKRFPDEVMEAYGLDVEFMMANT